MANYAIPNYPTRRVRYYNNQFLKDQDFIDDQAHRLSVSQAYLRALCVAGVCEGMTLRIDAQKKLQIAPGTAIDPDGKLIALDVERPGPLADNLADGDYLVHIRFAEEEDEMAPPVAGGAQSNTRFTQKPIFGATKRGIALPPGAVVLGTFAVTQTAVASQSAANRQFSGVRLPGPSPAGLSTLRHLGAGDDSATLTGGLAIRRDAASALGPTLSLVNGSGGVNAATAIDLASYDPAGNDPPVRVGTFDDGQYSSHLVISTKKPGAITNNLVERLRITSDGKMIAAAPTTISSTLSVTGDTTLAKTTAASLAVTADAAVSGKLAVAGDVALNGKHAFRANDTWLRLNQDAAFTSGVHTPGNFAPGALNVGGANGYGNPDPNRYRNPRSNRGCT